MAEYNLNAAFTIPERAKGSSDGKTMLPIIDVLNYAMDDFFMDAPAKEASDGLYHRFRRLTSVPSGTARAFYQGVAATRVTTQPVLEPVGLMESRSEVDTDEIDTLVNGTEERRARDMGNLKGLGKSILGQFVSGSKGAGDQIDGIETRLSSTVSSTALNVKSAGGSTALTSILVVEWDLNEGCFLAYPPGFAKGSTYGIQVVNRGQEKCFDGSSNPYYSYVTQFKAWYAFCCANELKVGRVANVESSITSTYGFAAAIEPLIQILEECKFNYQNTRIYVNETIGAQITNEARQVSNHLWGTEEIFGRKVRTFQGIPIRVIDRTILTNAESAIT